MRATVRPELREIDREIHRHEAAAHAAAAPHDGQKHGARVALHRQGCRDPAETRPDPSGLRVLPRSYRITTSECAGLERMAP